MRPACTLVTPSRLCPVCERPLKKNIGSRPMPRSCEPQLYWKARLRWSIRKPQSWGNYPVDSWSAAVTGSKRRSVDLEHPLVDCVSIRTLPVYVGNHREQI